VPTVVVAGTTGSGADAEANAEASTLAFVNGLVTLTGSATITAIAHDTCTLIL